MSWVLEIERKKLEGEAIAAWARDFSGEGWISEIAAFLRSWYNENDHVLVRTSGSTGKPKEIHLSKEMMRVSARNTAAYFELPKGTRAINCLPARYVAGMMMFVRAEVNTWNLRCLEPSSDPFTEAMYSADFTAVIPMQIQKAFSRSNMLIPKIIVGGAPVSPILEDLIAGYDGKVYLTYGMTETATHVAVRPLDGNNPPFEAMNGVTFSVDERGCLIIDAQYMASQITTNDMVELVDSTHFRWMGRADHVINSGGMKIHPEQLEARIGRIIDREFYLKSAADDVLGERLEIVVEGEKIADLDQRLRVHLDARYCPKRIHFRERLKRTETGKIIRE